MGRYNEEITKEYRARMKDLPAKIISGDLDISAKLSEIVPASLIDKVIPTIHSYATAGIVGGHDERTLIPEKIEFYKKESKLRIHYQASGSSNMLSGMVWANAGEVGFKAKCYADYKMVEEDLKEIGWSTLYEIDQWPIRR
ncbi:MAG TPA: hypothetical protein VHA12_02865 [Candidatus Nanoarchaeia archaeon]|nr:hypothetical protein [Candidatus Nanoarchaeia archaeon]